MKRFKFLMTLLIAGMLLSGLQAQVSDLNQPIPPDKAIITGKLENGLHYYIKENKKPEQRMELRLAINAGSVCETENQQGLAHFVEHMCFNGTKNFPSNKMIDMLEEMGVRFGAEINASTSFDETVYMLKIPTDKEEWINRGFQVLEDWAHQVTMDDKEIDKERGVIVEEWRLGLGADDRMMQKYIPVILKDSRYATRLPIGKVDIIKSFPYDTLRNFYKTWYRPDLMAVVVVGDIDPAVAEKKIKEYFGKIPAAVNPKTRIEYAVPDNTTPLISVVKDKEASDFSASVFFKHPKAESITYNDYREMILRTLYTGMLNNRLQEIAQKPESPYMGAGAGYGGFIGRSTDVYSLSVSAKENQIGKSIETVMLENEKARRFGFTLTELEREKRDLMTYYERAAKESDKTESESYADEFVRNFLSQECIPGIKKELEIVTQFLPWITLDEINKKGAAFTSENNIAALITAQEKEGVSVPSEKEVSDIISSVKSRNIEAYIDNVSDVPLLVKDPVPTPVVKKSVNQKFGFTELQFGNGVRMILLPTDYKNDEILLASYSPGGISIYPDNDVLTATIAPTIIAQSGLGSYDYVGLQKKLSGNTARVSPNISELREGVSGNCSPKDIETMLQLNYLYFTGIRKDENAFNAYLSRLKNTIKPMRTTPQIIFQDTLSKIISSNSPRVISVPTEAQLNQVNLERLIEIYKDRFSDASDFTYFMVGNFKIDEVTPLLEKYIGGLPSIKRKETWKDQTPEFPKGQVTVDVPKNSEPQSTVAMVWNGDFKWKQKDRFGFSILMNILSIKLRETMREDQGGVYGVSISGTPSKFPKPEFTISSSWGCNPDNISKLSEAVLDEMKKIISNGPTETDLNKVKETLIRERETRVKENSYWMSALQSYYLNGNLLLSLEEFSAVVNSFTINDIKAIAKKYLNPDSYVKVALTPAPGVEKK